MKNLLIPLVCSLTSFLAFSQSAEVSGFIYDHKQEAIFFSNVVLYSSLDSSIVKVEYSNEDGSYVIKGVSSGKYFIEASFVGFPDTSSPEFELQENEISTLEPIFFPQPSNELEEVTVKAKKPLLEMKPDKLVLNVEGSINASGSDAFTLLRQSPGVVIDNNDNIFMLGKSGLKIYIDNRPTHLSGSDLAEYLKTIPSSEIESIEIITNPSAKYEAEGNAGIVNIKLRRDKNLGANGSITSGFSVGHRAKYNTTIRGTYKSKKWNTYGSLTGYSGQGYNPFNLHREQLGITFKQRSIGEGEWKGFNSRVGIDYALSEKSTLGILINGSKSTGNWMQNSQSDIFQTGSAFIDSSLIAMSDQDWNRQNWNINGNYKYSDKQNRSLNIDVDYGRYENTREEFQPNSYQLSDGTILGTKDFFTDTPPFIDIATVKVDYEQEALNGKLGFGAKISSVSTDNTFDFFNVLNTEHILNIERSNQFDYDEFVSAAYANYSRQFSSMNIQAGFRIEHTNSKGMLTAMVQSNNELVERDYIDLFPSFGITYQLNEKK